MNHEEIAATLRASGELREQIVRDIGMFTVALFALSSSGEGDRLQLAGTGTLVAVDGSHYVLTARHVWEERVSSALRMGITLPEDRDHRFLMDVRTIEPFGPPGPGTWDAWGPDIVFLRLPGEYLGTIRAHRVFYNLAIDRRGPPNVDGIEIRVLMGTPEALAECTRTHADVQVCGLFLDPDVPCQTRGGFDYFDLEVDTSSPEIPETFGGVSGGGLWKVLAYRSSSTGQIDSVPTLEGVAFYQSTLVNGCRTIRCHGPHSIRTAVASIVLP